MLYAIEAAVRLGYTSSACTDVECIWNKNIVSAVEPAVVSDIDFYKAEAKGKCEASKRKADTEVAEPVLSDSAVHRNKLLDDLNKLSPPPVVLSSYDDYCGAFVKSESVELTKLPLCLTSLYRADCVDMSKEQFDAVKCDVLSKLSVTDEQILYVESVTKMQADSLIWYEQRAGRITGSTAYSALHSPVENFSPSLLRRLCCDQVVTINAPAIKWGREHESQAFAVYSAIMTGDPLKPPHRFPVDMVFTGPTQHTNLSISKSGFHICKNMPFLGASPDGCVLCDCHGKGVVEIKCPFSGKEMTVRELMQGKNFYINSDLTVNKGSQYYAQIQLQMDVCGASYCDFVVWTLQSLLSVRVERDAGYISDMLPKLCKVWEDCVLPELLTKSLTKPNTSVTSCDTQAVIHPGTSSSSVCPPAASQSTAVADSIYCICRNELGGTMIGCDNSNCQYKWFHLSCLKLKRRPRKSPWFCKFCILQKDKSSVCGSST